MFEMLQSRGFISQTDLVSVAVVAESICLETISFSLARHSFLVFMPPFESHCHFIDRCCLSCIPKLDRLMIHPRHQPMHFPIWSDILGVTWCQWIHASEESFEVLVSSFSVSFEGMVHKIVPTQSINPLRPWFAFNPRQWIDSLMNVQTKVLSHFCGCEGTPFMLTGCFSSS